MEYYLSKHFGVLDNEHTGNFKYLLEILVKYSVSNVPHIAMREWLPIGLQYDDDRQGKCVCKQKRLYELYTIKNFLNGETLSFIGSSCVKRFGSWNMIVRMKQLKKKYREIDRYGDIEFEYGSYEGSPIKKIIKDTTYMTWLLAKRKPSSCKLKNEAYHKLLLYYDLKVNGLEIKLENVDYTNQLTTTYDRSG